MNWALLVKLLLIASGRQRSEHAGETLGSEAGSFLRAALEKAVQLPDTVTASVLPSPVPPCPSLSQLLYYTGRWGPLIYLGAKPFPVQNPLSTLVTKPKSGLWLELEKRDRSISPFGQCYIPHGCLGSDAYVPPPPQESIDIINHSFFSLHL